ncbi:DUF421 domain-containing protein [Paraglaciecola sp. L1A13]|uniref:DUF421 domain-containing protein n=1 Tax=Paraglaciecola sp. L1A13 TaxID=2686359 RepID=UPI00131B4BA5|nr:YetF domain-containing protein [Paraglaciecola sp. L1A13]
MFVSDPLVDLFLRAVTLTGIAMFWVVLLVRVNGLRSFSKMTNFDFVMTVAIGSLLAGASQSTDWTSFMQTILSMAMLFTVQYTTATIRKKSKTFESIMQNQPALLMKDGVILHAALKATRVAETDLIAKLREANVLDLAQVRAVVLETTGDISVIHGDSCSDEILQGVRMVKGE